MSSCRGNPHSFQPFSPLSGCTWWLFLWSVKQTNMYCIVLSPALWSLNIWKFGDYWQLKYFGCILHMQSSRNAGKGITMQTNKQEKNRTENTHKLSLFCETCFIALISQSLMCFRTKDFSLSSAFNCSVFIFSFKEFRVARSFALLALACLGTFPGAGDV